MSQTPLTQAAKNIRAELKQKFPLASFSVRSSRYSGGDSIRVTWASGPAATEVESLTRKYEQGYFDGMTDSYVFDQDPQHQEFHRLRGSTKYVMLHRRREVSND